MADIIVAMNTSPAAPVVDEFLVVDGHNDLPWALWDKAGRDLEKLDIGQRQDCFQTDIPRLREGQVGAQFWSVYVPGSLRGKQAVNEVLEQISLVRKMCDRYPKHFALATTVDQVRDAISERRIASLLGAEGGNCIDNSLATLYSLRQMGVRYMTLTHAENVDWADSATDVPAVGGLAPFGHDVVRAMNGCGMVVDLSHVATTTMNAALDASVNPVLFTHSSSRAVVDNPRNVPDDVLTRLRVNGGVCMVTFVPAFVSQDVSDWYDAAQQALRDAGAEWGTDAASELWAAWGAKHPQPRATLRQVADHIEHVREVAGIEHVGIGGDFDGAGTMPDGLEDVSCYPQLLQELADRGWSGPELQALTGENVLRVLGDNTQPNPNAEHPMR
ncbi:dipeptidase [Streptomyces sp. RS2]|uniref:dipeptidase n=1 Tax=Streptomyces sp. RS2 TaxID=1451205 RepID=UPI0021F8EBFB|nr:dipeptidase [Streptomyces sp. RS2]MCW1100193.1 dipeptidase [Streptomyces sp. RS2]